MSDRIKQVKSFRHANTNREHAIVFAEAVEILSRISRVVCSQDSAINLEVLQPDCKRLLTRCQVLFGLAACSIYFVQGREAVLTAYIGPAANQGKSIALKKPQKTLSYEVISPDEPEELALDKIIRWVVTNGKEFCSESRARVRRHKKLAEKPDQSGIQVPGRKLHGLFVVPLKLCSKTIGVLMLEKQNDKEEDSRFDETDKQLLRALADSFSIRAENAYLRTQLPKMAAPDKAYDQSALEALAQKYDLSGMKKVIERIPAHIEIALAQTMPKLPSGPFNKAILVGQGGSALPADVVADAFAGEFRIPLTVSRYYNLPPAVDKKTLIIACSFSGGTEEVLSSIGQLPEHAENIVVISGGGRLISMAAERGYPIIRIPVDKEPKGFQPRMAFGYIITYLVRLLSYAGIKDGAQPEPISELSNVPLFLRQAEIRQAAQDAAVWLAEKIPVVYTDESHLMSVARIAKIKFNENSKRPAFFNALPEANHNEMIGFSKSLARFGILYLHDYDSHPRIRQRFEVMKRVFAREAFDHIGFREWRIPGATRIQKIFAALVFADWCSYSLALIDGFDPTPVKLVENFKQELGKTGDY
jgi:glucose/mannose-6-phosphate isomerase